MCFALAQDYSLFAYIEVWPSYSIEPANVRPFFQDLVDLLAGALERTLATHGVAAAGHEHGARQCLKRVGHLVQQDGQSAQGSQCWVKLDTQLARTQLAGATVHIMMRLLSVSAHWLADSTRSAWELVCRFSRSPPCVPLFSRSPSQATHVFCP